MGKKKILILAICAAVVIGGSVAAVALLRGGPNTSDETTTTTAPETEYSYEYNYDGFPGGMGGDVSEEETDNSLLTTIQQIANTTKKAASKTTTKKNTAATTKKNTATTTKKTGSTSYPGDDKLVDKVIGPDGDQFLGYRYDAEGDYYYTDDKDCWQENAGFNEIYDNMTPLTAMYIDVLRVRFTYGDHDWMIQLWKGQYGWLLVGAEIGLYTAEEGVNTGNVNDINHYNCADQSDWLYMSMDCYWAEGNDGHYEKVFSRPYDKYWWPTGFVKGQLTKYTWPRTELKMKGRITFKDTAMADAFVAELKKSGFRRAAGSDSSQLVDDSYYQNGADVIFLWSTIYHDCFK